MFFWDFLAQNGHVKNVEILGEIHGEIDGKLRLVQKFSTIGFLGRNMLDQPTLPYNANIKRNG